MPAQTIIMYVVVFVVFGAIIFFMNRSQKKKQKQEEEQRNSVKPGDEIVTIGGFVVRVISIKDDYFVVESPAIHHIKRGKTGICKPREEKNYKYRM